jgi:hypothetical protein
MEVKLLKSQSFFDENQGKRLFVKGFLSLSCLRNIELVWQKEFSMWAVVKAVDAQVSRVGKSVCKHADDFRAVCLKHTVTFSQRKDQSNLS